MRVIFSDLDGTLIPNEKKHKFSLDKLRNLLERNNDIKLIFVTGRSIIATKTAIEKYNLPNPDYSICDVGTSIYKVNSNKFVLIENYTTVLDKKMPNEFSNKLFSKISQIHGITPQDKSNQSQFKLSFYVDPDKRESKKNEIISFLGDDHFKVSIIASKDPFENKGMIDILPSDVNKAFALRWLINQIGVSEQEVVFAGDTENDFDIFISGINSIIVGNADIEVKNKVKLYIEKTGMSNKYIYTANESSTSGVIEGIKHFFNDLNGIL